MKDAKLTFAQLKRTQLSDELVDFPQAPNTEEFVCGYQKANRNTECPISWHILLFSTCSAMNNVK